jgi:nucleoside-diphosphate-sugar epimerase
MLVVDKGIHRNVYHIGTGDEITIRRLVEIIFAWFGREAKIVSTSLPAGGTLRRCPDIGKLEALGHAPRIEIAKGIAEVAAWYVANAHRRPAA